MREERRREQTKLLNKLKGIETEEEEKKEDKNETKPIKEKKENPKIVFLYFFNYYLCNYLFYLYRT